MRRRFLACALAAAVLLAAVGCGAGEPGRPGEMTPSWPVAAAPAPERGDAGRLGGLRTQLTAAQARQKLDRLPSAQRAPRSRYDRDTYGGRWAAAGSSRCNARDDVLRRDAQPGTVVVARQGRCDHDVLAGSWRDAYSGQLLTVTDLKNPEQAQSVTVDHVVSLAEAHRSGADGWTARRRERFANDLSNLVVVAGRTNSTKGDQDPSQWRPRAQLRCTYASVWVDIKEAWALGVDDRERAALRRLLAVC